MGVTNSQSGTRVDEIADGIYRISTPVPAAAIPPDGFTFNQYLIVDEEPLLFHTGLSKLFPLVREAVASVLPVEKLRYISFSHYEADECGSLNDFLQAAPRAVPLCGQVAAMVSVSDVAIRAPKALADGETLKLGKRTVRWLDAPQVPHAWECGFLFEEKTRTLLCGDLFTHLGHNPPPVTEGDILGPTEKALELFGYYSHTKNARPIFEKIAATAPSTLACMHGSAWKGDGRKLILALADRIA